MANPSGHREQLDLEIRQAVETAKRKGKVIALNGFVAGLRARNPALDIPESYVLDRLVEAARNSDVVIEFDHHAE